MKRQALILLSLLLVLCLTSCALFGGKKPTEQQNDPLPSSQEENPARPGENETPNPDPDKQGETEPNEGDKEQEGDKGGEGNGQTSSGSTTHVHKFTLKVVSNAYSTGNAGEYYYSCSCGAKGSETFMSLNTGTDNDNRFGHLIDGTKTNP